MFPACQRAGEGELLLHLDFLSQTTVKANDQLGSIEGLQFRNVFVPVMRDGLKTL
jgi:ABC-type spermidine/putrescine transport system permease subunit I